MKSKKVYTPGERKAEREIDRILRGANHDVHAYNASSKWLFDDLWTEAAGA